MRMTLLSILLSSALSGAMAQPRQNRFFDVAVDIRYRGQVIGRPRLSVAAGADAGVTVAGKNGYALTLTIKDVTDAAKERVSVQSTIDRSVDGRWVALGRPTLSLELNRTAVVSGIDGTGSPYAISFLVKQAATGSNGAAAAVTPPQS